MRGEAGAGLLSGGHAPAAVFCCSIRDPKARPAKEIKRTGLRCGHLSEIMRTHNRAPPMAPQVIVLVAFSLNLLQSFLGRLSKAGIIGFLQGVHFLSG